MKEGKEVDVETILKLKLKPECIRWSLVFLNLMILKLQNNIVLVNYN